MQSLSWWKRQSRRKGMETLSAFLNRRLVRAVVLGLVALGLVLNYVMHQGWRPVEADGPRMTTGAVQGETWAAQSDIDLVFALYSEPLDVLGETMTTVTEKLPKHSRKRVIVYNKGMAHTTDDLLKTLPVDEVVTLPNIGREGETYLNHIIRHYSTPSQLATHTLFLQPHLAWGPWSFIPRLPLFSPRTGFLSFGPYHTQTCGHDDQGNDFPRMKDIFESFHDRPCPLDQPQLSTWAGQFAVSKERILRNPLAKYQDLSDLFHAPSDHPIWNEGWANNEPSNPTLGHALERTWPVIFHCDDPELASRCGDGVPENGGKGCQCYDRAASFGFFPSGEE